MHHKPAACASRLPVSARPSSPLPRGRRQRWTAVPTPRPPPNGTRVRSQRGPVTLLRGRGPPRSAPLLRDLTGSADQSHARPPLYARRRPAVRAAGAARESPSLHGGRSGDDGPVLPLHARRRLPTAGVSPGGRWAAGETVAHSVPLTTEGGRGGPGGEGSHTRPRTPADGPERRAVRLGHWCLLSTYYVLGGLAHSRDRAHPQTPRIWWGGGVNDDFRFTLSYKGRRDGSRNRDGSARSRPAAGAAVWGTRWALLSPSPGRGLRPGRSEGLTSPRGPDRASSDQGA